MNRNMFLRARGELKKKGPYLYLKKLKHVVDRLVLLLMIVSLTSSLYAQSRPNIIFILADDLGYGDVKCFNPEGKISTPHIDQLAAEGMKFTDAHSSSSVCSPSRYSILTGRYPWRTKLQSGVLWGYSPNLIEPSRLTVPSFLKENGYYTACIGKWHLGMDWPLKKDTLNSQATLIPPSGNPLIRSGWEVDYAAPITNGPNSIGFDYFYGISASLDMPPFVFIENDHVVEIPTLTKIFVRAGPASEDFEAVNVLPVAIKKAEQLIISKATSKDPFFLYLTFPSPHTPIVPSKDFKGKSGVTDYGDYVMETDWGVGRVMAVVDSLGLAENTIFIFSSDNGFAPYVQSTYHFDVERLGHFPSYIFRGYKSDIWDGGHRIPTIVRWPARVQKGSTCSELVSLTDLMATCASLLQKKLPENCAEDSYSILPYLLGNKTPEKVRQSLVTASVGGNFSIQKGKWKLIFCPGSGGWESPNNKDAFREGLPLVQLYNMETDVSEKINLEGTHRQVVKRLTKLMESYIRNGRSTPGKAFKNEVPIDLWKKGYQSPNS